jgi:hypothetical protein
MGSSPHLPRGDTGTALAAARHYAQRGIGSTGSTPTPDELVAEVQRRFGLLVVPAP